MALLTEEEWQRLLPLLDHIKPARREAAYNRLVRGMTLARAGEVHGYSRQDVGILVNRVLEKHAKLRGLPDRPPPPQGWARIELLVPRDRADEVRRLVAALYPPPEAAGAFPASPAPAGKARRRRAPAVGER